MTRQRPWRLRTSPDLIEAKRAVRQRMLAARAAWDPACGAALGEHVLREVPPRAGAVVSGFWPMGPEIDIRPLLVALHERGHPSCCPKHQARQPADLSTLAPGLVMVPEHFGTLRPDGEVAAAGFPAGAAAGIRSARVSGGIWRGILRPDAGGLPGRFRLGVAYAAQELDEVPAGPSTRDWTPWRPSAT